MDINYQPLHLLRAPALLPLRAVETASNLSVAFIWDQTTRYILDNTDTAAISLERLNYEIELLTPLSQAITYQRYKGRSEIETLARCQRLGLWKQGHLATLERFKFWRRAVLFGVEEEELTPARRAELWLLAEEAIPERDASEWSAFSAEDMVEAMSVSLYPAPDSDDEAMI